MTQLQKTIKYFRESAKRDLKTSEFLFKGKRYDACLFFCHLALEKLLKGILVAKTDEHPPFLHDLVKLATLADLDFNAGQKEALSEITDFNIAGRYDDKKYEFYKQCTQNYARKYFNLSKELFLWLKNYPIK